MSLTYIVYQHLVIIDNIHSRTIVTDIRSCILNIAASFTCGWFEHGIIVVIVVHG